MNPNKYEKYNSIKLTNPPQMSSSRKTPDSRNPSKKDRRGEELPMEKNDLSEEMRGVHLPRRMIRPKNSSNKKDCVPAQKRENLFSLSMILLWGWSLGSCKDTTKVPGQTAESSKWMTRDRENDRETGKEREGRG